MSLSTDRLIKASRSGDREAFGQLVERFQGVVTSITLGMTGDLQHSEDIAQETFLKAWTKLGELRDPEKIGSWLCTIARNLCRDLESVKSKEPLHFVAELESTAKPSDETQEQRFAQNEAILAALQRIPENYRQPLILFYRENLSIRDIANTLELSEDAVKQRLSRGRKHLRNEAEKMFEELLQATRPGTTFTIAVLAALPILQASAASASVVAAAGASGATATATGTGKGFSVLALGTILLNILYPAFLLICVPVGVRNTYRFAPTLRLRRFGLHMAMVLSTLFWTYFACALVLQLNVWGARFGGMLWGFNFCVGLPLIWWVNALRKLQKEELKRYHEHLDNDVDIINSDNINDDNIRKDISLSDARDDRFQNISLTPQSLWRVFYVTTILTLLGLVVSAERTYRLMITDEDFLMWKLIFAIAFFTYGFYFYLLHYGLKISQDQASFEKTAPLPRRIEKYFQNIRRQELPPKGKRKQFFLKLFGLILTGSVIGVVISIGFAPFIAQLFWSPFFSRIITRTTAVVGKPYPVENRVLANGIRVWYLHEPHPRANDFSLIAVLPGGAAFGLHDAPYAELVKNSNYHQALEQTNCGNGAYLDNIPYCAKQSTENWRDAVYDVKNFLLYRENTGEENKDDFRKMKKRILDELDSLPRYPFGHRLRPWVFAAWNHRISGYQRVELRQMTWNMTPQHKNAFSDALLLRDKIVLCGIGKVPPKDFFEEIETQFESIPLHESAKEESEPVIPGRYSMEWDIPTKALLMMFKIPGPEESLEEYAAMIFATYSMQKYFFAYQFAYHANSRGKFDALEADVIKLPQGYFLFFCVRPIANCSLEEAEELIYGQYIAQIQTNGEVNYLDFKQSDSSWTRYFNPKQYQLFSVPYFCDKLRTTQANLETKYDDIRIVYQQEEAYQRAYQDYIYRDEKFRQHIIDTCERLAPKDVTDAAKKYLIHENCYLLQIRE